MKPVGKDSATIPSLDGIRALAATIVFASHAGNQDVIPGLFGVTVFFFLSGYLITTLLRTEFEKHGRISLRNFYLRRAFRIFPPMYIVLVFLLFSSGIGADPDAPTLETVSAQFLHITNYYRLAFPERDLISDSAVIWSLAVEEHFYLLYPLLLIGLLRFLNYSKIALLFAGLCVAALAWRCVLTFVFHVNEHYTNSATDARIDSLLFGCIMGIGLNPFLDRPSKSLDTWKWTLIISVAALVLLTTFLYRAPAFRQTARFTLQGIALFPIFYCSIRHHSWLIFRWLNFRPIRAFGMISYTFYLIHVHMLGVAERLSNGSAALHTLIGFSLSLAFSVTMYYLVERHMGTVRRRLHQ